MVPVPGATPVIVPPDAEMIEGLLLNSTIARPPPSACPCASSSVTTNVSDEPTFIVLVRGVTVIVSTAGRVTMTETCPCWPSLVAVIDAVPAPAAVTTPVLLTFATLSALDDQVMVLPDNTLPPASLSVGVITTLPSVVLSTTPTRRFAVAGLTATDATGVAPPLPEVPGPVMSLPPHATARMRRSGAHAVVADFVRFACFHETRELRPGDSADACIG